MPIQIKIFKDDDAIKMINDTNFINECMDFYNNLETATVFQHPHFVLPWYYAYSEIYSPLIVVGYKDNIKVGLMFLGQSKENNITHAGDHQAEYHGWLTKKEFEEEFIVSTLITLNKKFSLNTWEWRWLPKNYSQSWIYSDLLKNNNINCIPTPIDVPLFTLANLERFTKIKKNKTVKNLINRYKRNGDFHIERVTTKEKAEILIEEVIKQYDFRIFSQTGLAPFGFDKNKKAFYLNKMEYPKNVHFSVLWAGETPIAFHIGDCDDKTLFYGLPSFSPMEFKKSPGRIFLIKLSELLIEEGFETFDLTPGMDANKEKFSNESFDTLRPTFYFDKTTFLKAQTKVKGKKHLKTLLNKFNQDVDSVKKTLDNISTKTKSKISPKVKQQLNIYKYNTELSSENLNPNSKNIRTNCYEDLLLKTDIEPSEIFDAQQKLANEETLYSVLQNNKLVSYVWVEKDKAFHFEDGNKLDLKLAEKNITIYDFYSDPALDINDILQKIIENIIATNLSNDIENIYVIDRSSDDSIKSILSNLNFELKNTF